MNSSVQNRWRRAHQSNLARRMVAGVAALGVMAGLAAGGAQVAAHGRHPPAGAAAQVKRLPIGIQAWSEHVAIDADAATGYPRLAGYGVRTVELYGIDAPTWETLPKLLAANRLTPVSALIGLQPLISDPAEMVRRAKSLGLHYLGVGWIRPDGAPAGGLTAEEADRAAAAFNTACPIMRANGITQILHIHGYEFVPDPDGAGTMLDRILAKVPARCLSIEMDIFWVRHAGQDPMALLRKLGTRTALMHLKDPAPGMPTDDTGAVASGHERALGAGTVDWPALLAQARLQGVKMAFIEDETGEPGKNVPQSVAYLRHIGALR
jgi:sugar phosphate isomerase/epimerase